MGEVPLYTASHPSGIEITLALQQASPPLLAYWGTSLIRNSALLGLYGRNMPRVMWWSWGVGVSLQRGTPVNLRTHISQRPVSHGNLFHGRGTSAGPCGGYGGYSKLRTSTAPRKFLCS